MDTINATHVGKRLLLTDRFTHIQRTEAVVVELSPSGQNVKLKNPNAGTTYWTPVEDHRIVEELRGAMNTPAPKALVCASEIFSLCWAKPAHEFPTDAAIAAVVEKHFPSYGNGAPAVIGS